MTPSSVFSIFQSSAFSRFHLFFNYYPLKHILFKLFFLPKTFFLLTSYNVSCYHMKPSSFNDRYQSVNLFISKVFLKCYGTERYVRYVRKRDYATVLSWYLRVYNCHFFNHCIFWVFFFLTRVSQHLLFLRSFRKEHWGTNKLEVCGLVGKAPSRAVEMLKVWFC